MEQLELTLFDDDLYFYKVTYPVTVQAESFLYIIRTSGSTGEPKIVRVPQECIMSNIVHLKKTFELSQSDQILCCSPSTFDPFVVDLFLGLGSGCSLMFLENFPIQFYSQIRKIFDKNSKFGSSFCQITPSVFRRLSLDDQQFLMSDLSSLKTIAFGGESFPLAEISQFKFGNKSIFNLYGITEISSWSLICKYEGQSELDLGASIDDEICEIREENELWIGSSKRKCFIDTNDNSEYFSKDVLFRRTGDVVEVGLDKKMYYRGRTDNLIKRFGIRVSLHKIESTLVKFGSAIRAMSCIFDEINSKILVFYVARIDFTEDLIKYSLETLSPGERPDEIIKIDAIPMSDHGKVSTAKLIQLYKKITDGFSNLSTKIHTLFKGCDLSLSFPENGGDSVQAIRITTEIEFLLQKPIPILVDLLNKEITVKTILTNVLVNSSGFNHKNNVIDNKLTLNLKESWRVDLKKCVDANPIIFSYENKEMVAIGSHSHDLVVIELNSGLICKSWTLPDRIESPCCYNKEDNSLIVGCYDEFLYKFGLDCNEIIWKFDSGGMIKCQVVVQNNQVIFGNYSPQDNLFALNFENGQKLWSKRIGNKGILANPLILPGKTFVIVCTQDGTVEKLKITTGTSENSTKLESPVFASPTAVKNHVIIAEVTGKIHCLNSKDLSRSWAFELQGNVFSSAEVEETEPRVFLIWTGSHDHYLYCLISDFNEPKADVNLVFKIQLDSQVFCSPRMLSLKGRQLIVACTTSGSVYIINRLNGQTEGHHLLAGEIFSSPAIWKNLIVFGCRDNNVYCLEIENKC